MIRWERVRSMASLRRAPLAQVCTLCSFMWVCMVSTTNRMPPASLILARLRAVRRHKHHVSEDERKGLEEGL
jgi:hypothetical protein